MSSRRKAFKAAFPYTIPLIPSYIFLAFAFGVLMSSKGYGALWPILMSVVIYAGAMQYVTVNLLTSIFNPLNALVMTLVINARHLFYGVAMLEKFSGAGRKKPYLIFGLTDETFSLLCSAEPPVGVDRYWFMFFITLIAQFYWVAGTALGVLLGENLFFNIQGLDFVMTALFIVIFINQWKSQQRHDPALAGLAISLGCLLVFGPQRFIIPAMVLIVAALLLFHRKIDQEVEL
ncbi:MAG TPA: AzlC family ABC transporter permease [Syntrophomonas sp.]|nr:AzlC family ABC transporter permease [Syntrophomonas sp.]